MSAHHQNLSKLFNEIQAGDHSAFNSFFESHYAKLVGFAQFYTNERESAEEVVSEFYVKIWQNRVSLHKIQNPEIYSYIAVKNASLNAIRAKQRRLNAAAAIAKQQTFSEAASDHSPVLEQKELNHLLDRAVEALPHQRRLIFSMIKTQGLKPKDVSEILGLSSRTVENHLYKAVKALAEHLHEYLGYHPQGKR